MRSANLTTRRGGIILATSLLLALCVSLLLHARPWLNLSSISSSSNVSNDSNKPTSARRPLPPDLDVIPVLVPHSTPSTRRKNGTISIELLTLPGIGGSTPPHGLWDGHAVVVAISDTFSSNSFPNMQFFSVLAPIGGCTFHSGHLSKTSINAARNTCDVAINGSPFGGSGGCIGQSLSNGTEVCSDCDVWDAIPSFGFSTTNLTGKVEYTWVMGTGINYTLAKSMGISNLIVGHDPGWLIRNGTVIPSGNGGVIAPRTAVGISSDGAKLILLVVDGCEHCSGFMGGPQGLTIHELALEMAKLGAAYAMNLDGGGSSTLFYRGKVANHPTSLDIVPIWSERRVSTAICLHG